MFLPTKPAAFNALELFLPHAGRDYRETRNYDTGPAGESTVSKLSPWIRIRMLPEWKVLTAVLERHRIADASKFIDEVCWRTYWKGWLQLRPTVWEDYLNDRAKLLEQYGKHPDYLKALEGRTGIKCFDTWNSELITNNYLHNHARMWYASIWIHTLKLPWQLGADWFLRHLLDGDPASNTLSWRWVAGLHTRGKTYLARPDNIRKYTNGRFQVGEELATEAIVLNEATPPAPRTLPIAEQPSKGQRLGLLVNEEDLSAIDWISELYPIASTARYFPVDSYREMKISPAVLNFRHKALSSLSGAGLFENSRDLLKWARQERLEGIVMAEPTTGHWPEVLERLRIELAKNTIKLFTLRHWWDQTLFPHATQGFFRFKKAMPQVLEKLTAEGTTTTI